MYIHVHMFVHKPMQTEYRFPYMVKCADIHAHNWNMGNIKCLVNAL